MTTRLFKWLLAGMVLFAALVVLGQWLLGSKVGRELVEQQLEGVIGLRVRLGEEFGVRVLPTPGVRGNGIALSSAEGEQIVSTQGYLAKVALWPLLKGDLEVIALELQSIEIPFGSEGTIGFENLTLAKNPEGAPLLIDAVGTLSDAEGAYAHATLAGTLDLAKAGSVTLGMDSLDLEVSGFRFNALRGEARVDIQPLAISLDVAWDELPVPVTLEANLSGEQPDPQAGSNLSMERLQLHVGEYLVEGDGCFKPADPAELHLRLSAQNLDIDTLTQLAEAFPGLALAKVEDVPDSSTEEAAFALPFDAFVRLEISQARYQGATARGVVFRAGGAPDCPGFG